ncbi:SDR family oxidoreductase [Aurantibacter sp.]|uniref:SDR family oxidoreductase n=1 Tax=Aurantibacter sp. TaxID=2807103 RepID=UPI0035C7A58E
MFDTKYHNNQDLNKYKFLVTGGAGFIGSNLVEYLLKYNAGHIVILDNFSNGYRKNIAEFIKEPNVTLIEGDIQDFETCKKAVNGVDYVLHQAALGSVPRSLADPVTTNNVNISGYLNMLQASKDANVKRMVYAASSSTYGDSKSLPKIEDVIGKPLSPYAITKYVNELYADIFSASYGFNAIGLRYFNVFGPKQDPNGAYAAVIPLFFDAAVNNTAVKINGDGEQTRDFTFIENVVQANLKSLFATIDKHEVFNVAVGERISVNNLWNKIANLTGTTTQANYGVTRPGDVRDSLANIDKGRQILGYNPLFNYNEGLEITHKWFKANKAFLNEES